MADSKISNLSALTSLTSDDLICVVDSPGSSPVTKKITAANFSSSLASLLGLSIGSGKTLTASNTLTLAGTDGSTLNVGTGGTLGSNAFSSTAFINGSGTTNTLSKFTAGATLGNSRVLDNGTAVDVQSGTFKVSGVGGTEVSLLASEGDVYLGSQTQKFLHVNEFLVRYADAPPGTVDYFTVDTTNNNAQIILQSQGVTGKRLSLAAALRTYAIGDVDGVNGGTKVAIDDGDQTVTIAATGGLILPTITAGLWHGTVIGAAYGGFGADISASSGVPLFATGTPTFTGTSGSGNFVRVTTPTIATPSLTTGFTIGGVAASGTIPRGNGTNFIASAFTLAVPGTSGNVLTSDGTNWTSAAPAGGNPFDDGTAIIKGSGDATKLLRFEVDGFTPGTTRVITPPDSNTSLPVYGATITYTGPTAARTVTYPDANFSVARKDAAETFSSTIQAARIGIGVAPIRFLDVLGTTEQVRVAYDASNYYSSTVSSNGSVTFDAVGSGAGFTFNDTVTISANITATGSVSAGASNFIGFTGRSYVSSPSDGNLLLSDNVVSTFGRLQFGGITSSFGGLARDGAGIRVVTANSNTAYSFLGVGTNDSGTNTIATGLIIAHQSTGTPAAGLGEQILFNLNSSTTADQNAAAIAALWTTATHASRTADLVFYTVNNAASLAEGFRVKANLDAVSQGNLVSAIAGKGLQLQSGTGARAGTVTLVGGTATVTNTTVGANTIILLTRKTSGGTIGTAITYTISNGTSFTVSSDNILDTSTFVYHCIEVN